MTRISIISGSLFDASFDGTDLSDKLFYCYDIKKPLIPQQSQTTIDIPKMPGLIQLSKKFVSNQLTLKGFMKCTDYDDLKSKLDELSVFLYSDEDQQLILSNANDRYWNCQYLEYDIIDEKDNYALIDLPFTCNDPFGYAITPDNDTQYNATKGHQWTIANNGQYWAYPVCTITFNQSQTHIYLRNTSVDGCRFDISKSFVNTDVLVINSKDMSIRLNDVNSPAGFGDGGDGKGAFILFKIGDNLMEIGTDDATLDVDVNINFRKIYL